MENLQTQIEGVTATYSPDDNKIRISSESRIDSETFARLKAAGYKWAPKQRVMVAPMWTPAREAIAIELAGHIGDDDASLIERAEERAERFDGYSANRAKDAQAAKSSADAIAGNIPFGQPILVGHHSQKRAERDAQKIERALQKSVKMWETSEYWEQRAAGALAHAKYKEKPEVRARRIKKIETDKRRNEKETKEANQFIKMWNNPDKELTHERALLIAGHSHIYCKFPLDRYPRPPEASQYEGSMGLWSALDGGIINAEQAKTLALKAYTYANAHREKWLTHYNNRLAYEKAMLGGQGRSDLIAPKKRPKQLPICNYKQPEGFTLPCRYSYRKGEMEKLEQIELTKAQYSSIAAECRGTRKVEGSHRIKIAHVGFNDDGTMKKWGGYDAKTMAVFLTDSKVHKKPEPVEPEPPTPPKPRAEYKAPEKSEAAKQAEAAREQLKAGVTVATGEQLFATPPELAARVIDEADIKPGELVLEPSAGTGALLDALPIQAPELPEGCKVMAIEDSSELARGLLNRYPAVNVFCADFLQWDGKGHKFDKIVMNPPFSKQADIDHVNHALTMLKQGGRLVAIMSAGVDFRSDKKAKAFRALVESRGGIIEPLPAGSFKQSGTGVNTVLVIMDN